MRVNWMSIELDRGSHFSHKTTFRYDAHPTTLSTKFLRIPLYNFLSNLKYFALLCDELFLI